MTSDGPTDPRTAETAATIPAPPDAVWQALTTSTGLQTWLGPETRIDPAAGGRLTTSDPVGGRPRTGRVDHVVPYHELAFTWWPDDDPDDRSQVVISIGPAPADHTRVTVTEIHACAVRPTRHGQLTAAVSAGAGLVGAGLVGAGR